MGAGTRTGLLPCLTGPVWRNCRWSLLLLDTQVREATGPNSKNSPFYEELLKAQEAAQAGNKGLWTKVCAACSSAGWAV